MERKIAVLGTGAIGGSIGADLTNAGYDVLLVDQWPAHVEAMKAHGLRVTIRGKESLYPVRAMHICDLASLKFQFDIVFLACKVFDSSWMAQLIEPYLKPDGVLVATQNSLSDEWISPIIGGKRDIGCAVELSAQVFEPGLVKRRTDQTTTQFVVGELDGKITPRVQEVARIMSAVGKVRITTNIWGAKWSKLVHSTASLCLRPIVGVGEELLEPPYLGLSIRLGTETARVAEALGIVLEPIFGLTKEDFNCSTEERVRKILHKIQSDLLATGKEGITGKEGAVLQDLLKGRKTETSLINGLVAKKGRQVGVPTPINDIVTSMMREIEQGKRKMMDRSNFKMLEPYM